MHARPGSQALSQLPQWLASLFVSTHAVPHFIALPPWQQPSMQVVPLGHSLPQAFEPPPPPVALVVTELVDALPPEPAAD
jgi:hypothetical protein